MRAKSEGRGLKSELKLGRPFLTLENAAFRLGDRLVFENTSWRFQTHEHWAVLGPNGSGKSIFADALRGHLPLVEGSLRYHFRPAPGLSPEEAISHVAFEDRRAELHEAVVQSRWNSLEESTSGSVRGFLSYERVLDLNPYEVQVAFRRAEAQRRRARTFAKSSSGSCVPHFALFCSLREWTICRTRCPM